MTPERWQQLKTLFRSVLECEPSQRAALLEAVCADDPALRTEIESLLAYHEQAGSFIDLPAVEVAADLLPEVEAAAGRRIGPYKVIRELGHGGMGAIYLAERADDTYRKRVAIKLIRPGMDTQAIRQRFHQERQILADLDHPNIARLIDGGATEDGLSYFVMDYVEGLPIDVYCDMHQLSIAARLTLFRTICSAVQYAHERHVIHRDLKPGNILVTAEGVPKLLDFGIAKLLDPERSGQTMASTLMGLRPMTPEYASPEQVRGKTTTPASDVYALGLLLYELMTGHRPYCIQSSTPQEVERIVCEEEPEKPSRVIDRVEEVPTADGTRMLTPESASATREGSPEKLRRRLTGDLDNIITMALRKEPERRYASVAEFSEDMRRHLEGRPVLARKDRLGYRTAKFIQRNKARVIGAALLVVVLLTLIGGGLYWVSRREKASDPAIHSLAVLPLENFSRDPEQEYFADGMTEALITDLSQIGALKVTSRTSVMSYKGTRRPLLEIGRALKVDAVIVGSVQRAGNRVRITVQLIQTATDRHLWAKSYEGDLGDMLALQSRVAQSIAQEVKVQLTPQEQTRLAGVRPVNQAAYDAYLKGRYFWNVVTTEEATRKSIDYYEQAIAKDSNYALAYAGLAHSYLRLNSYRIKPPGEFLPKAKMAAMKAVTLDDTLAEAHTALGQVKVAYEWDWSGAEREFQRALALNPRYAHAHFWYGHFLMAMGRPAAAVTELKRAQESDPLSLPINLGLAWGLSSAGQYEQALEQARQVIEMDPNHWVGHLGLGQIYEQKGMYEEALIEFQKAVDLSGGPLAQAELAYAYAVSGKQKKAERLLQALIELSKHRYVSPYHIGEVYAGLGEKEQAFQWLNKAYDEHSDLLKLLKVNLRFNSLHSDPRFADLVRRVGLPP